MAAKQKKPEHELATVTIRIYPSTHEVMRAESKETGKTIARLTDEKYRPARYEQK